MAVTVCAGAFGSGGYGALPYGSGGTLAVDSIVQVRANAVEVTFLGEPKAQDPADVADALNRANWTFSLREPFGAAVPLAQTVERVDSNTVRVFADARFTAGATYQVDINPRVETVTGQPIDPLCVAITFIAYAVFVVRDRVERDDERVDFANPQLPKDAPRAGAPLGTFQINDRGDFENERGTPYLRKRILRRATTAIGSFFHLPTYGFAEPIKSKITTSLLRRMQARAQTQILSEPDVRSVTVSVSRDPRDPGLVILKIVVTDREGNTEPMTIPVDVSP